MRTLRFIVDGQIIKQDPTCDFSDLVPGTEGYLRAEFSFSPEWTGCVKVAGFFSNMGFEYRPQVLKDGKACIIPSEALEKRAFKVQVIGKKDNFKLTTNKLLVAQTGGKV
jgi:hypothetical protein